MSTAIAIPANHSLLKLLGTGLLAVLFPALLTGENKEPSEQESLQYWEYFVDVPLPKKSGLCEVFLTPDVFDGARYDLADLRLYDAEDQEVPYALRVLKGKSERQSLDAESFNSVQLPSGAQQLAFDLGDKEVQYNEVSVQTSGINFRRRAVIEGSDDQKDWKQLATGYLMHFRHGSGSFRKNSISFPSSRFRYLRVSVYPDLQDNPMQPNPQGQANWSLQEVVIQRRVEIPGQLVTRSVEFGTRSPVPTSRGPGSQWLIDLGGRSVPCTELLVEIESSDFVRDWEVEANNQSNSFRRIESGVWQRKAGEKQTEFTAEFPQETRAKQLKLLVTDNRNTPLQITSVKARAPARQLLFEVDPETLEAPLRLYFGNPSATEPRYDFARNLPAQLDDKPTRLELGKREDNPIYQPKPKPFTERFRWLVHCVFAVSIFVLGVLIVNLAQAALARSGVDAVSETSAS